MGKLIVIEGLDGSGKSTQLELLPKNLTKNGIECKSVSFPDYDNPSSTLVKMYLKGDFGKKPGDVNAYAASSFYGVDRYTSFKMGWGEFYNAGGTVVSGRYTTSNAVHQCSKLPEEEWESFLEWLYDFEYNKIAIPKPDKVIFLDMPIEVSQKLLSGRYKGDESKKDIHESDTEYLARCRKAALFTAKYSNWEIIPCSKDGEPRTIDEIAQDVLNAVLEIYKD
ncbi:MAG: deoxynucleoside kinase [Clostridia bacterium]|nr:deoxynucleoside kinase [Clostridia bacterium]